MRRRRRRACPRCRRRAPAPGSPRPPQGRGRHRGRRRAARPGRVPTTSTTRGERTTRHRPSGRGRRAARAGSPPRPSPARRPQSMDSTESVYRGPCVARSSSSLHSASSAQIPAVTSSSPAVSARRPGSDRPSPPASRAGSTATPTKGIATAFAIGPAIGCSANQCRIKGARPTVTMTWGSAQRRQSRTEAPAFGRPPIP